MINIMNQNYLLALCFCIINSIRYLIFGLWHGFNDTAFDFVQFAVFNYHLSPLNNSTSKYQIAYDLSFWAFFGLSPHPNSDNTITHIYDLFYGDNSGSNELNSTAHSISRRQFSNSTVITEVEEIINWFDENKFLISSSVLFTIVALTFIVFVVYSIIKIYCGCKCKESTDIVDAVPIRDGTYHNIETSSWNVSYFTFLVKVILIAYCSIATITLAQIIGIDDAPFAINFMAIFMLVFLIGFPLYVGITIYNNKSILYRQDFMDKFGPLYLGFKTSSVKKNFMVIVLIKQLLYAITINISSQLNWYQNTILLVTNVVFIIILWKIKPYAKNIYQIQAVLMSISMIVICILNYVVIGLEDEHSESWFRIFNSSIHIASFGLLIIIQIYGFIKERQKPTVQVHDIESDRMTLIRDNDTDSNSSKSSGNDITFFNPLFNPEYKITNTKRYSSVLGSVRTDINN